VDALTGEYKLLPVLGLRYQKTKLDKQLKDRSDFNFKSQCTEQAIKLTTSKHSNIKLAWLYPFDSEISYHTDNNARIIAEIEPSHSWLIGYRNLFDE